MSEFKVYPTVIRFDGTTWPRVNSNLNWKLRYAQERITKEDMLGAASIISAYDALVIQTQKRRNKVCKLLSETILEDVE